MRQIFLMVLLVLATATGVPASAKDSVLRRPSEHLLLRRPLPDPTLASKTKSPITPEAVRDAVDARIRSLFVRAADPSTGRVTVTSAENAGLGYFTGHFAAMDSNRDSSLTYDEVKDFLDAQSPIEKPATIERPAIGDIQIIE
ncbi:hypothetical protein [Phyllobacterium bourgognense]|uniref:EF-hand domain-containing protein n=1 Tax=Phyllobacterium bourgognense TaxID=314236 RepID=A0A368Z478_9HYPH|nr:hypothetical protein [Phyllobacterium bourgognense]RCW87263.1 hypothetical protein C7476_10122 [Phyllobacterium bourgognense]